MKNIALFFASPFISLAYAVMLPGMVIPMFLKLRAEDKSATE